MKNSKGQSLIETAAVLPALVALTAGLLFCLYFLLAVLWTEHWVYRANMCLAEGESRWSCESALHDKMQIVVSQKFYTVREFWITPSQSHVSLNLNFSLFLQEIQKTVTSDLDLPLKSRRLPTREVLL